MIFPRLTTSVELFSALNRQRDIKYSTRTWHDGHRYKHGQTLKVWTEDDPRTDSGILPIASYVCVESGDESAVWQKQQ